jgi:hypothetical protein
MKNITKGKLCPLFINENTAPISGGLHIIRVKNIKDLPR